MRTTNILIIGLLLASHTLFAQIAPVKPKNNKTDPVTINLKSGELLTGRFATASASNISIRVGDRQIIVRWSDITRITFGDTSEDEKATASRANERLALQTSVKLLRRIEAAVRIPDLTLVSYLREMGNIRKEFDDNLADVENPAAREHLIQSLIAYADAKTLWNFWLEHQSGWDPNYISIRDEPVKTLSAKYAFAVWNKSSIEGPDALKVIWTSAKEHLDKAVETK